MPVMFTTIKKNYYLNHWVYWGHEKALYYQSSQCSPSIHCTITIENVTKVPTSTGHKNKYEGDEKEPIEVVELFRE